MFKVAVSSDRKQLPTKKNLIIFKNQKAIIIPVSYILR